MSIESDILKALQTATINAVNGSVPIKAVGLKFQIPADAKYLEIVHIPNNLNNEFWGNEKTYRGLFRLLLHWPAGPPYDPTERLETISNTFVKGATFTQGSTRVKITENPDFGGIIEDAPNVIYMATMRYELFKH